MKFKDPFEPTKDELRTWANDPDAGYPDEISQDWDLILATIEMAPDLIELACEDSPKRKFFLKCLYIVSGDSVRNGVVPERVNQLSTLFDSLPDGAPSDLVLWSKRSQELFGDTTLYDYDAWGWGDLAYEQDA